MKKHSMTARFLTFSNCFMFLSFRLQVSVLLGITVALSATAMPAQTTKSQNRQQTTDSKNLTAKGIEAFQQGDDATSRALLESALKSNSNNGEAHTFLGILDDKSGDLKNAEIHFAKAAQIAPNSASARNNYGAILLRLNRLREAKTQFEESLKLDAKQPNALINLAQIYFNENTPESLKISATLFEKADALAPDVAVARSLIIIALRLNDPSRAAKYYGVYTDYLTKDDSKMNAAMRAELGDALLEANLLNEAEKELSSALLLEPSNTNTILNLGRVYLSRNDVKSAGRTLETAVARNYATAAIYSLLAVVYEKSGHYENAIPAMRLALQLEPNSEKYHYQYGIILTKTFAPAAAIIRVKEALNLFPNSSRLWLALGLAHINSDEYDNAIKALTRAVELDPKFAQAYAYIGLIHDHTGQYEEAIKMYERALQINSNLAVVHQMLAALLLKQKDSNDSQIENELKKAVAIDAKFTPAYMTLGKLYIRMEKWSDAAVALEKAVQFDPELVEGYYHLARVYTRLNRKTEAQAILTKFKAVNESQKEKSDKDFRELTRRLAEVRF